MTEPKRIVQEYVDFKALTSFALYEDGTALIASGSERVELSPKEVEALRTVLGVKA